MNIPCFIPGDAEVSADTCPCPFGTQIAAPLGWPQGHWKGTFPRAAHAVQVIQRFPPVLPQRHRCTLFSICSYLNSCLEFCLVSLNAALMSCANIIFH